MTTIVDTFNRADATTLGTTSDGLATWATTLGAVGISTNQAAASTLAGAFSYAVASIDTSAADGTVQVTISQTGAAPCWRIVDGSNFYFIGSGYVGRIASGSFTDMLDLASGNPVAGDIYTITMSGSTMSVSKNGGTAESFTDTTLASATKHGVWFGSTTGRLDNWGWNVSSGSTVRPRLPIVRTRAVSRSAVI